MLEGDPDALDEGAVRWWRLALRTVKKSDIAGGIAVEARLWGQERAVDNTYQKQLPYNLRGWSCECAFTVARAGPVAFVW